jgi:hypothetical protein
MHERHLRSEVVDLFRERVGVSPEVKQHLANSGIEFVKVIRAALRAVLDERIDRLAAKGQQGTRITVE